MKLIIIALLTLMSPLAHAFSYIDQELVTQDLLLSANQVLTVPIDEKIHQVQKLLIDAEGIGSEAMFEVVVNGTIKGTVHVPGVDPRYTVTIAEAARSIELRHLSGRTVRVRRIIATISRESLDNHEPIELPNLNFVTDKSLELLSLYRKMWDGVSPQDRETYLLPLRISTGRLYAIASGHGDMSAKTRQALQNVIWQIEISQAFWDQCFRNDALFDFAVEILAIKERLAGSID